VPWESAYAIKEICPSNTTFVLGASGHVAGIVNPVHKNKYCFWRTNQDIIDASPEGWLEKAEEVPGSWWPEWFEWIKKHAGEKKRINIWETTENIEPAPGRYVLSTSPRDNF
jgi:polyhydroxyalkanoate synthase